MNFFIGYVEGFKGFKEFKVYKKMMKIVDKWMSKFFFIYYNYPLKIILPRGTIPFPFSFFLVTCTRKPLTRNLITHLFSLYNIIIFYF